MYECGPKTNRIISVILQFFLWRLEIANLFDDFISSNLVYIILKDLNVIDSTLKKSKKTTSIFSKNLLVKTDVDVYKQHPFLQKLMLSCTHNISFYKNDVGCQSTTSVFT